MTPDQLQLLMQLIASFSTPAPAATASVAPATPAATAAALGALYGKGSFYAMSAQTPAQYADLVQHVTKGATVTLRDGTSVVVGDPLPPNDEVGDPYPLTQAAVDAGYFTESTHADGKHDSRDVSHYTTVFTRQIAYACAQNRYADNHVFDTTAERDAYIAQHDANVAAQQAAMASYGRATPGVPGSP